MASAPLPIIFGTAGGINASLQYGFTRTISFLTDVHTFQNGGEQRAATRPPLYYFSIPLHDFTATDKTAWSNYFNNAVGRFNSNLQVKVNGTSYNNCVLTSDSLAQTNQQSILFNQAVQIKQTSGNNYGGWSPVTAQTTYPMFSWGSNAQMPYTQIRMFYTLQTDSAYGTHYATAVYAGGFNNSTFPTTALKAWRISYPLITQTDATTLENFFVSVMGRYASFTFKDPQDSTTNTHVRFGSDELVFKYVGPNLLSTEVSLVQTNNS